MRHMTFIGDSFIQIRLLTALVSLCLSLFACYNSNINNDGILYLYSAEAYLQDKLATIAPYNNQPFFSIIIAYVHVATSLSFESIAYLLNGLLLIILFDMLLLISKKMLPNNQQIAIAAIILLCFQSLNEYREFVIRDFGYWAFASLALYRFIIFTEQPRLKNATYWQLAATLAFLFRIEGVFILLGLPFYLFIVHPPKIAVFHYLKAHYLLIAATIAMIIMVSFNANMPSIFYKIERGYQEVLPNTVHIFNKKALIIATQVLSSEGNMGEYGPLALGSILITILVFKIIKAMSLSYIGLFALSCWQNKKRQIVPYQGLVVYFVLLTIIPLAMSLFISYLLSTRYTMMTLVSLLLLMLPRLIRLIEETWTTRNKTLLGIIVTVLLIGLADGVTSSRPKPYIKDIAIWASNNLPKNITILTNNRVIDYYYESRRAVTDTHYKTGMEKIKKNRFGDYTFENVQKNYQNYDYLIIFRKRKDAQIQPLLVTMALEKIHCQGRKRSGEVCVYKVLSKYNE